MHIPVLLQETIDALDVKAGGRYVDGTLGRAGHTREILVRGGTVLGIDRDDEAVAEVSAMKLDGLSVVKGRHGDIAQIVCGKGWEPVDGVLLDLGVSSPQLDEAGRGFSFMREGPLDMRMDRTCGPTAADFVNNGSAEDLERIFRTLGEESRARALANGIVRERAAGRRFETTTDLGVFVENMLGRHGGRHPATRVFQALRMFVNDEMGELERALDGALDILKPGGRLAVITFESLTDRIVKRFLSAHAGREVSLQEGGARWEGKLPRVRLLFRKAVASGMEEAERNPRSRSAKLRAAEKEGVVS